MDEGSISARISRYETGVRQPPFATVERLAAALEVPVTYFYCADECLAEFLIRYESLSRKQKDKVKALVAELGRQFPGNLASSAAVAPFGGGGRGKDTGRNSQSTVGP